MTDYLVADSKYINDLATEQDQAATELKTATDDLKDSVGKLWFDHGPACGECITALQAMAKERTRAGNNMQKFSQDLATTLRKAANDYHASDVDAGDSIDEQVVSG